MNCQLRAGVEFQLRKILTNKMIDPEVLNDQRIHADGLERCHGFHQFRQLILANNGIDGYEDAPSRLQAVGVSRDLVHFLQSKILRFRAGGHEGSRGSSVRDLSKGAACLLPYADDDAEPGSRDAQMI